VSTLPPTAPRFSRLEPDDRRGQILSAARRVFTTSGLAGASMAAIADEAGVTRGLLNHYFGTKRDLYLAVVVELAAELPLRVRTDLGDVPLEQIIDTNVGVWLDTVDSDRALWLAILGVATIGSDPEVDAIITEARDAVVERMALNHSGGRPPSEELRLVLRVYLGALEAAAREWALRGRASREQVHALLVGTLLAMVRDVLPLVPRADAAGP